MSYKRTSNWYWNRKKHTIYRLYRLYLLRFFRFSFFFPLWFPNHSYLPKHCTLATLAQTSPWDSVDLPCSWDVGVLGELKSTSLQFPQTWPAGKSTKNWGFNGKIIHKWWIFHCHLWWNWRLFCLVVSNQTCGPIIYSIHKWDLIGCSGTD